MKEKFIIIDGNAIIHRAYHALPPLTAKDGTMVNAVYGFASMLLKVLNDLKPEYIAVSFDVAGPTFRDKVFKEYKAKRVKADQELYDQIPLVYEVVQAFGIPIFTKQGFEADDVIGTIANKIQNTWNTIQAIIVTGDKDFLQLVDDDAVEVYLLKKGMSDFELYNETKVNERFGFGPEHIVDYKSLRGDTSDNIPGVPGIGEKTATELIQKFGGIGAIYKNIKTLKHENNEVKPSVLKKLEEGRDSAFMSKELATIRRDVEGVIVDLKQCLAPVLSQEMLLPLFQKFSFTSLLKRIPVETRLIASLQPSKTKRIQKPRIIIVDSSGVERMCEELEIFSSFACKEIIRGKNILEGTLDGFVFATEKKQWFVPIASLSQKEKNRIWNIFSHTKATLIGHDLKQLLKALQLAGVGATNKLFDLMIASYVLNSSTRAHDLASIVLRELGKALPQSTEQSSLFGASPDVIAEELLYAIKIYERFAKELEERSDAGLFEKVEMALIPVLAEMELNGVAVDGEMLKKLSREIKKEIEEITKKIHTEAGVEFNVASSAQLREVLFEKMGLPMEGIKKGKTGYSTSASELEKLRGLHPIIEMIEEHRELAKLQNTYVDVLPTLINKKTGRIHTSFNQAVASTGRLSSSDPNLQNIPIRTPLGKKIRDAFIAEDGYMLVAADYSQIELRIVASLANDTKMLEIFEKGEDIHRATAAAINGVPLEKVTKEMRRAAKEINFGVLYGMGAYGLSWRAGIPQAEAKAFIEKYFREFSGVKKYLDQTLEFAKKEGYVETLFGRRRYIPELTAENYQLRSAGERMAVNMPIQGTAADLMKMAMIAVYKNLSQWNVRRRDEALPRLYNDVRMILQVHDELVLEVKKGLEDDIVKMLKETMEHVAELRVLIEVLVHVGTRWGEMK